MRILFKEPGKPPRTMVIPHELSVMQQLVDGYIEPVRIGNGVVLIVNEEGKLRDMDANFLIAAGKDSFDLIYGPAFFCGENGEYFDSIPDSEIERLIASFEKGDFIL